MKRQNRTLIIIFAFVLGLLGYVVQKVGVLPPPVTEVANSKASLSQDALGEPIAATEEGRKQNEISKNFNSNVSTMFQCLGLKTPNLPKDIKINSDTIIKLLEQEWGLSTIQGDHALTWSLKMPDGVERRIRIEITENEEKVVQKEMKFYIVNKEGISIPVDVPEEKRINPSDQTIDQLIKEGEVTQKERLSFTKFQNGGLFESLERDENPSEVSIQLQEKIIRCPDIKTAEPCDCGIL
jgi:hypothetical protein